MTSSTVKLLRGRLAAIPRCGAIAIWLLVGLLGGGIPRLSSGAGSAAKIPPYSLATIWKSDSRPGVTAIAPFGNGVKLCHGIVGNTADNRLFRMSTAISWPRYHFFSRKCDVIIADSRFVIHNGSRIIVNAHCRSGLLNLVPPCLV